MSARCKMHAGKGMLMKGALSPPVCNRQATGCLVRPYKERKDGGFNATCSGRRRPHAALPCLALPCPLAGLVGGFRSMSRSQILHPRPGRGMEMNTATIRGRRSQQTLPTYHTREVNDDNNNHPHNPIPVSFLVGPGFGGLFAFASCYN